ncbi:hypothetical protein AAG570_003341 [Ranatra chinensis]|uniref:Uncharacterized protein n=1 Tax=Ranatra chinensis TaxID=642074 RepID=A0ABD0YLE6_9HEMI
MAVRTEELRAGDERPRSQLGSHPDPLATPSALFNMRAASWNQSPFSCTTLLGYSSYGQFVPPLISNMGYIFEDYSVVNNRDLKKTRVIQEKGLHVLGRVQGFFFGVGTTAFVGISLGLRASWSTSARAVRSTYRAKFLAFAANPRPRSIASLSDCKACYVALCGLALVSCCEIAGFPLESSRTIDSGPVL